MFILLVGPKGSGKSHIGRLLEADLGVHFFHVEPLWMSYYADCARDGRAPAIAEGIVRVRPAIQQALSRHRHVCIETTGASTEILQDLLTVAAPEETLLVRVRAPLSVCLERVVSRDQTHQIPMEEEMIRRVHALAEQVELPFAIDLENVSLTEQEVLAPFRNLLRVRFHEPEGD